MRWVVTLVVFFFFSLPAIAQDTVLKTRLAIDGQGNVIRDAVIVVQHALGLAMALVIYVLLLRRGTGRWLAALAIAPLQDLLNLGAEARMNHPGRAEGNWRWRCTEEMLSAPVFQDLRSLTETSDRLSARSTAPF